MPPNSRGGLISALMGPKSAASFRPREKYLIILVLATFCFVCFGAIFFLPTTDSKSGINLILTLIFKAVYLVGCPITDFQSTLEYF